MQALNYLRELKSKPKVLDFWKDELNDIDDAVKFVLPVDGIILDNDLETLPDELNLPFPFIVLEFPTKSENRWGMYVRPEEGDEAVLDVPDKRMIVARQVSEGRIEVYTFYRDLTLGHGWMPTPAVGILKNNAINRGDKVLSYDLRYHSTSDKHQKESWFEPTMERLVGPSVLIVCELLEALSCSNVGHKPLEVRKLNKSAMKRGALPFDQYHVLSVAMTKGSGEVREGLSQRSPREHLRRGHTRTYQSGLKLWIQKMVVNPGVGGKIIKDYRIKI